MCLPLVCVAVCRSALGKAVSVFAFFRKNGPKNGQKNGSKLSGSETTRALRILTQNVKGISISEGARHVVWS